MHEDEYFKLSGERPIDLARRLKLDPSARAVLMPDQTVAEYVVSLAQTGQFPAAITVLAHALPKREAVWWGCLAVRHAEAPPHGSEADAALAAAEAWVYHPDEEHRRPTRDAAALAGLDTPAGWTAIAAFWSGGSLTTPDNPDVPPREDLTGQAVAGAATLAAVQPDAGAARAKYVAFIKMALDVARGGDGRHVVD